ncbi:Arc family DNA-binding protein [Paraburkholderia sp.]|uniref:Arc family DNA-binding protein n=1 Tax=Paraburkholderia sp. TaxID=1926495 RepID=UPI0039E29A57
MATQDDYIKTALRLPRHLHADISVSAENAGRSMNAEIIDRLSKVSDTATLYRAFEQLTESMKGDKIGAAMLMQWVLQQFGRTVDILDETVSAIQDQKSSDLDLTALHREAESMRKAFEHFTEINQEELKRYGRPQSII